MLAVTGATGYLGRALLPALIKADAPVLTIGRRPCGGDVPHRQLDFAQAAGYRQVLEGVHTVIHCAGLAHHGGRGDDYDRVNLRATVSLADAALSGGCRHFIFISSLNLVPPGTRSPVLAATALPRPEDRYASSKWQAEQQLEALQAGTPMALTLVRPALIYDQHLVANLAVLATWLARWPLALPALGRRAMVSRDDLVALLVTLAGQEAEGVRRFAITDGDCYDLARIARALSPSRRVRVPVPGLLLRAAAALRDRAQGLPPGATWAGLAGEKWCPGRSGDGDIGATRRLEDYAGEWQASL